MPKQTIKEPTFQNLLDNAVKAGLTRYLAATCVHWPKNPDDEVIQASADIADEATGRAKQIMWGDLKGEKERPKGDKTGLVFRFSSAADYDDAMRIYTEFRESIEAGDLGSFLALLFVEDAARDLTRTVKGEELDIPLPDDAELA